MSKKRMCVLACLLAGSLHAAIKLPALISDHMVLQQGVPVRIWGSADPGESVRVEFQGQTVTGKAAENGKWVVWLKPLSAAGPLEMNVNGTDFWLDAWIRESKKGTKFMSLSLRPKQEEPKEKTKPAGKPFNDDLPWVP